MPRFAQGYECQRVPPDCILLNGPRVVHQIARIPLGARSEFVKKQGRIATLVGEKIAALGWGKAGYPRAGSASTNRTASP